MTRAKTRRQVPDWVLATGIVVTIFAVIAAVVWLIVVLVAAAQGPGGQDTATVSWQCTEFGDRLYWHTGYPSRGFAVVPGGCRS